MGRLGSGLALLAVLSACTGSPTDPTVPAGEEFQLAAGEFAVVEGADLGVRFELVASDSRCPADAFCITQGDAEAVFTVTQSGGSPASVTLHTGLGEGQRATFGSWTLTLTGLDPYPYSARPISPHDHRARLRADRTTSARR
jgi:hypothetical protein